jgi:hypothetical protein
MRTLSRGQANIMIHIILMIFMPALMEDMGEEEEE